MLRFFFPTTNVLEKRITIFQSWWHGLQKAGTHRLKLEKWQCRVQNIFSVFNAGLFVSDALSGHDSLTWSKCLCNSWLLRRECFTPRTEVITTTSYQTLLVLDIENRFMWKSKTWWLWPWHPMSAWDLATWRANIKHTKQPKRDRW